MFDRFARSFQISPAGQTPKAHWDDPRLTGASGYSELARRLAGCSLENGLYRFHDATSGPAAETLIAEAFPDFAGRVAPFASDWLGRQFGLDAARREGNEMLVLMLEPGTGQALEIPASFAAFHDQELVDYAAAALARDFFAAWASSSPEALPLPLGRCVGYKVPLFLGGADTVDNLELTDVDVYWTLSGQLLRGIQK